MNCPGCGHAWHLHGGRYFEAWCIGYDAARGVYCGCAAVAPRELVDMPPSRLRTLPGVIVCGPRR